MKVPSRNLLTGHWQLSTPSITAIGLLYVVGVGVLDIYCPPGMLLNLFYLLGIAYVAGRSGSRVATVTVSFAAVAVLTIQETVWSRQVVPPWVEVWNFSSRLVVFSAMGWLIVERTRLTRNLERLVDERTVQCKTEVEQHKNTSARLAEAIERFEQVVNNITEVFWLQDFPDYRLRYVSPGYERIWGRTCAEVYADSKSWLAAIHPDDREEIIRRYPREQAGGGYDVQYRILRPDGAVRWIRDSAFPVRNAQGEVYRITGIAQDITEERQSREALQTQAAILENMEEGVVVTDDQGLIVQMNPAAERIWRYTQSDILGRPASVLSGLPEPEASEGLREVLATLHATGSWRGMLKNRHQNGEAFFCEAVMSRLKIHGRVLLVAVEQDVTEHKRVEAVLRESEQTYRALVEITGTGYLILDLLGRVVDANAEYVRLSGHQVLKEILGRNLSEWTALHDRPITIAALGECAKTRSVRNLEIIYAGPNGLLTPIEINATVVGTEQGARIICLCRDITQRKQTELALARTEELYPSLFELSPDGILLEDTEGNILDANQAICDTFGYSRQELVGANVRLWVPPAENGAVASHLAVLRAGQGLEHEVWNRRKNGQVRLMKLNEKPLVLPDGHQDILVVARDITESKQIEEALHKAHDRLELRVQERTAELQAANAALAANETRLRLALEASNAGTWEWDVAGDQSVWDERYHELYGFEPDEPISFTT